MNSESIESAAKNSPSREIKLTLDGGLGERSLIAAPGDIVELTRRVRPGLVVIAANGMFSPPFLKGSTVLRQLRSEGLAPAGGAWRRVLSAGDPEHDLAWMEALNESDAPGNPSINQRGVWHCGGQDGNPSQPDVILLNLPVWALRAATLAQPDERRREFWEETLSACYRSCLAALEAVRAFRSGNVDWRRMVISDLGGGMTEDLAAKVGSTEFHASRIKILAQVLGSWVARSAATEEVHVAFGERRSQTSLREAWDAFTRETGDARAGDTEFLELRRRNAETCRRVSLATQRAPERTLLRNITAALSSAADVFSGPIVVSSELGQGRMVAEALAGYLAIQSGAVRKWDGTLESYIRKAEETGRFAPWLVSYLHLLRILGNNALHLKEVHRRRPEQPVARDLHAFHAVLDRVLDFAEQEMRPDPGAGRSATAPPA